VPGKSLDIPQSTKELELVKKIARRDGVTVEEAATRLASQALAERVRRRTGKGPAKLYPMKRGGR
jgi:hypothetical protein